MAKRVISLQGVFAPVTTPFDARGELDERAFVENLKKYRGIGLSGIVVSGSTGEAPFLTERERLRLVSLARKIIRPPELLLVGTGLESTPATIRLSREVIRRGADALLVVTPGYYKSRMDSAALIAHYRAVARAVSKPVLIYSIPQFTGVNIEVRAIAELSRYPNIFGLKESSGNIQFVRQVIRHSQPGFRVLVGSALILLEGLESGAAGAVLGPADFVPDLCLAVADAFGRRQLHRARELQELLAPLVREIAGTFGVPGIKAALEICGYRGGPPRSPLLPVTGKDREAIAASIARTRAALGF